MFYIQGHVPHLRKIFVGERWGKPFLEKKLGKNYNICS